ncbi:MAG: metal-dependent transcriptional regulator [Oscillochloridaceae bacterium]|nr:metal-dependent transcriptional regulator [Chloroflexaceae bacterium]MDW8389662.1 metal-dependent transcriptional regulator [Oscillochloridaceae bacterium]
MSFRTVRTTPLRIMDDAHTGDHNLTPAERAYLEVIAYLEARREPVLSVSIARWLKVRPPTVTHMLQRLEQKGLIRRDGGHSIALTSEGAAIAERIIRRHRLLECFLHDVVGVPWHEVHREATLLEPVLSSVLEARITELVGQATVSPHGNPIPGRGTPPPDDLPLVVAPVGDWFVITRIDEEAGEDSCTLQFLWTHGLVPGTPLVRMHDAPGSVRIQRAGRRVILSRRVAGFLWGVVRNSGKSNV